MIFERNQFTFYKSYFTTIEEFKTNTEKLQAYRLLCAYALFGSEPDLNAIKPGAATFFRSIRPVLDRARTRAEAGQRGGRA